MVPTSMTSVSFKKKKKELMVPTSNFLLDNTLKKKTHTSIEIIGWLSMAGGG